MPQQPRQRNDRTAHAVVARDLIHRLAQTDASRVVRAVDIDRQGFAEPSTRERTPREQSNLFAEALLQSAVLEAVELRQADLHLMRDQAHRTHALEQRELMRFEIADTELAHLPRLLQSRERLRHFLGLHQVIGPMQHIDVDCLDAESLQ
jgi:hypothetical protein